jgi:hypothetical protein
MLMQSAIAQTVQMPPAPPPGFFDSVITSLTSPGATAFGWLATVLGFIVGIIPLLLYFKERRSNEAMKQLVDEFSLAQKVKEGLSKTQAEKANLEKESETLLKDVMAFEADIKERLPREAKVAFLKNAIPVMEEQIYALMIQKDNMAASLAEIAGPTFSSPAAQKILSAESEVRLSAKRKIDTLQIQLSILTGLTSIILFLVPYPLDRVIVFLLAIPLAIALTKIALLVQYVFPDAFVSRLIIGIRRRSKIVLYLIAAFLGLAAMAGALLIQAYGRRRGWYF